MDLPRLNLNSKALSLTTPLVKWMKVFNCMYGNVVCTGAYR